MISVCVHEIPIVYNIIHLNETNQNFIIFVHRICNFRRMRSIIMIYYLFPNGCLNTYVMFGDQ